MSLSTDFYHELHRRFTGEIRTDAASRILYSTDASMYQIEPLGVVFPRTQEDLIAAVELAAQYRIPILPRGAGTSLGGQAIGAALILDCSRWLDAILEIDPETRTALVEPGVVLATLNQVAARQGLMFGPDPASAERATLGGVIGNNATGAHSILYGMTADHLLAADVLLGDGTLETWDAAHRSRLTPLIETMRVQDAEAIRQSFPKTWRNSAGYRLNYLLPWSPSAPPRWVGEAYPANLSPGTWNLAPLLAGSEGTLAILRRARLQLVPRPRHTLLGVLAYASNAEACDDVPRLLGFQPSAIELIPRMILQLARTVPAYARQMDWVTGDPAAVLVVEFSGDDLSHLKDRVQRIGALSALAETAEAQTRIWNIRKVGLGIMDSRPQAARPVAFIEDCAIPVERLGAFVREVERILSEQHVEGGMYAHASAGCLHIRPILDLQTDEGVRAIRSISSQVFALTMQLGGSMSSEHGDGIATGEWVERTYGSHVTGLMRTLKQTADPYHLLNPGKLFDAPPLDTHLRFGAAYQAHTWVPVLNYEYERGLTGAIEHCNGQGVCRKTTGVMCPSFQATRDEMNSTRGRANLLRALISQPDAFVKATDLEEQVAEALDLCLACKGCKAECPSGVDMAKLKAEFENRYYRSHRRPWRDYLFGYFHHTARLAAAVAPLANWLTSRPGVQRATARILQLADQRPFPKFAGRRAVPARNGGQRIIFLSDPFARYVEPATEQAAFDVLAACGYDVQVLPVVGAGAALMSKGFLSAARHQAQSLLKVLKQVDPQGEAVIIGIEPPEVYCLKHDYQDLLPDRREELASLAARTWLLDEFLLRSPDLAQHISGVFAGGPVFFHPHCHQRAEGLAADGLPAGTLATVELLRKCGYDVTVSEAGCCGMAGTFGYEAEHYELAMQVGELKLLPTLRSLDAEVIVAGSGAACRMQMAQGAGARAVHPLELVRRALGNEINIQEKPALGLQ